MGSVALPWPFPDLLSSAKLESLNDIVPDKKRPLTVVKESSQKCKLQLEQMGMNFFFSGANFNLPSSCLPFIHSFSHYYDLKAVLSANSIHDEKEAEDP